MYDYNFITSQRRGGGGALHVIYNTKNDKFENFILQKLRILKELMHIYLTHKSQIDVLQKILPHINKNKEFLIFY